MPANTFKTFFMAGTMAFMGGMLSLLISAVFLAFNLINTDNIFLFVFFGIILNIFCPFVFCIAFLLPLAAIDKRQLEERSPISLMKRYTPIITLPFGAMFIYANFLVWQEDADKYFLLTILMNFFCISVFGLFSFIRNIK